MEPEIRNRIKNHDLETALCKVIAPHFPPPRKIKRWRRRLSAYSSSYTIENLAVELDRGRKIEMVLKDLSPRSLLPTASQVRPHFLYNPTREIATYLKILNTSGLGTPFCYGAVTSSALQRYWLFLERVRGPLLWQMGRMEFWLKAAAWMARLHDKFARARAPDEPRFLHLPRYGEPFFRLWMVRAEEFLRKRINGNGRDQIRRFRRLADHYDKAVQMLTHLPTTFIHGEFYPSNIMLRDGARGREICPVDWELAAIGPGLIDLAAMTSGQWSRDKVRMMIVAYREAIESAAARLSVAELEEGVTCCQLHISIQLLGWAGDWSPPERHTQNWLRRALELGDKLGL